MSDYVLAIDIGTTNVKIALFDIKGNQILVHREKCVNTGHNGSEMIDPSVWWNSLINTITKIPEDKRHNIRALSISGQGPTIVPMNIKGNFNQKAITWLDNRHISEISRITEEKNDPQLAAVIAKLSWMGKRIEEPHYLLQPADYICYQLSGKIVNMTFDCEGYIPWNKDDLNRFDLSDKFIIPELAPTGDMVGKITKKISKELDLPKDVIVVSGAPDFAAALVGTGTVKAGYLCDRGGTSQGVTLCSSKRIKAAGVMTTPYFIKNHWKLSGIMKTSGKAIDWFCSNIADCDVEQMKTSLSLTNRPSNIIFLPYLSGERSPHWNPNARGVFFGLTLDADKKQMLLSILEGISFSIADIVSRMENSGCEISKIRTTGGQATNDILNQIKSDVLNKKIELPHVYESELLGTAIFAISALKNKDIIEMSSELVKISKVYYPDISKHERYLELLKIYRDIYINNIDSFSHIAKIQKRS
ncbi:MAG: carbohydrate kinase [Kosmotoga sp.]|nr:MAG: carbohydrate kinase [Kosmotoga sp.]